MWHCWEGADERTPLILLHGGWGSWTHWIKTIPAFAEERAIYAVDLPGMGESSDAPKPHNLDGLGHILAENLEILLPSDQLYHAVCFSFGGLMGAWIAARHGTRCRSITFVGSAGFGELHHLVGGIKIPDPSLTDIQINEVHRENLKLLMFADAASVDALALYIHRHNIARGRVRTRRISCSESLLEVLPRIHCPMGGIWGSKDATGGGRANILKRREILRSYQPDCQFDVIEGAGHWVMYEAADRFNKTLRSHLRHYEADYG